MNEQLEELDRLYYDSKDTIQGVLGFNVSRAAGHLLDNLKKMRDLAAVNIQKNENHASSK